MVVQLCSVHLRQRLAMLTDGQIIPVTALLDQDGLDTDDPHEAWTYTAGPDKDGKFHADELTGYNLKKNQIN